LKAFIPRPVLFAGKDWRQTSFFSSIWSFFLPVLEEGLTAYQAPSFHDPFFLPFSPLIEIAKSPLQPDYRLIRSEGRVRVTPLF